MNFLELVNRTRQEGGISGAALASLGGTLSQESQRVKSWVNDAWREVQLHCKDWDFMRGDFTVNTVAADNTYTATDAALTDFRNWKRDSLRVYSTAIGTNDETVLRFLEWERFRDMYLFGAQRDVQGKPWLFSVKPDKSLILGPVPDAAYTVVGEYFKSPSALVGDTDAPTIAAEHHMLIVWRAVLHYGLYESASEVVARAELNIKREMTRLEADQAPEITWGGPLA